MKERRRRDLQTFHWFKASKLSDVTPIVLDRFRQSMRLVVTKDVLCKVP